MFHYGRMKASSSKIIKSYFLPAYGTNTIGNHTSICEGGKWTAQELTWGKHYDVNDVARSKYIVVMGSNPLEAHTSHEVIAQRIVEARAKGAGMVTFDVRLSNTAAVSDKWYPVKPGTDGAVALAMAHILMSEGLYDEKFINKWTNVTVQELKDHLARYTPEWAEGVSGVPASEIRSVARAYGTKKPSTIIRYRGVVAHSRPWPEHTARRSPRPSSATGAWWPTTTGWRTSGSSRCSRPSRATSTFRADGQNRRAPSGRTPTRRRRPKRS
jgi:anaerobic selenocysteine-containing dehydrogenase